MKPSEVIQERGWIQNTLERETGVCIMGAVHLACHGSVQGDHDGMCKRMRLNMQDVVFDAHVPNWNDVLGRTVEQVIALLQEFEVEFDAQIAPTTRELAEVTS